MAHKKSYACIKPDGDGCDGNHADAKREDVAGDYACAKLRKEGFAWGDAYHGFIAGAQWERERILGLLRSESLRCNEPNPVRTGFEWVDWLEKELTK